MTRVLLLATGDTIAHNSGRRGRPGIAPGAELVRDVAPVLPPGLEVVAEDVMAPPSWDMPPETMLDLARRARAAILERDFAGVVITYGVDTMEDVAFLVDLYAGRAATRGGIVLTAASRPRDDPYPDGPGNLAASLTAAADPALRGMGAVVCAGGELHAARWVATVAATGGPAFSSAPHPPVGRVSGGRVSTRGAPPPRPPRLTGEPDLNVALIMTYPGMGPEQLRTVTDMGARGVVLAGTGAGNVPVDLFAAIGGLVGQDIPVVIASRAHTGGEPLDDLPLDWGLAGKLGAIGARGLSPVKARAALMAALAGGGGVAAARDYFAAL